MELYNYHWEIKDLLAQFLQAFDGAIVRRYDNMRNPGAAVAVRYVYSPKQRALNDLVNKAQTITIPAVAFSIGSISRDVNRVFNKLESYYYNLNSTDSASVKAMQPVPVNITVNISILTRFQTDMDQILSNFVPWSDPYFIISWTNEALPGQEIRTEILWDGSLKMGYPIDLNNNQPTQVTCDTTFTIKGWLFKSIQNPVGRIFKIDSNFYATDNIPQDDSQYSSIANILNELNGTPYNETVTVSARPFINFTDRWITPIQLSGTATLLGNEFSYTNAVYLSATVPNAFIGTNNTVTLTAFSQTPSLSALYPNLPNLIPALNYQIVNNNKLIVTYQGPSLSAGDTYMDVVVVNPAGYSILSKDTYQANSPVQMPYAHKGIQIVVINPEELNWTESTFTWNDNTYTWLTV